MDTLHADTEGLRTEREVKIGSHDRRLERPEYDEWSTDGCPAAHCRLPTIPKGVHGHKSIFPLWNGTTIVPTSAQRDPR